MTNQKECCRCCKMLDQPAFEGCFKTCREYMIKRRAYKERNTEHVQEQSKEWYRINKEEKLKYYQDNIETIKARTSEKINCDLCGSIVGRCSIAKHKKTDKCKTLNEKKNEII